MHFPILIGDIGGTNARFGLVRDAHSTVQSVEVLRVGDHASFEDAMELYCANKETENIRTFIIAVAGARDGDDFTLTNGQWRFCASELTQRYDLKSAVIMNDFSAQALAALAVQEDDLIDVGEGTIIDGMPKLIVGPGTGLGVANVIPSNGRWIVLPGEGGHMDLGPRGEKETEIWRHLKRRGGRVSGECVLSGSGLENLYQAIAITRDVASVELSAPEVTSMAASRKNPVAIDSVDLFVELLGRIAGDLALVTLPRGGVYLAGGIVTRLVDQILNGNFRLAFEDKAPHGNLMKSLPVKLVNHPAAALEGLALFARSPELFSLEQAVIVHR